MAKPTRIAIDLTLLLDLAANHSSALEGLKTSRLALDDVEYLVSPVTLHALAHAVTTPSYSAETHHLAKAALERLQKNWGFKAASIKPADLGVCEENAKQLVSRSLLGGHAWNSAHTIAEAACLGCAILLTHDAELLDVDYTKLKKCLESMGRDQLWITTPGEITRQVKPSRN